MLLWLLACAEAPAPGAWTPDEVAAITAMIREESPRADPSNGLADDPAAARLGQALFFDPGLSPSGEVSCATCHQPALHFTDGRILAEGVGTAGRHTPGIEGSQWGAWFFWDGRADSLWSQALGPIENPAEMGGDRVHAVRWVLERHGPAYAEVFGPPPAFVALPDRARPDPSDAAGALGRAWESMGEADRAAVDAVFANVGKAIAAYERRLVPGESALDRYARALAAGEPGGGGHLSDAELAGLSVFLREGACVTCHHGPMLTDRAFHNLGTPEVAKWDPGRAVGASIVKASPFNCAGPHSDTRECPELRYLDPSFPDFQAAFKTPSLRNAAATAPYMHNGRLATLDEVLEFYSELPTEPPAGHRELTLRPLHLDAEQRAALIAFLGALDGGPVGEELAGPPR